MIQMNHIIGVMSSAAEELPAAEPVLAKHHALVRVAHWANVPILLGLILSGLSIYWASPVYRHAPDPATGTTDYLADAGRWIAAHVPGQAAGRPGDWIYDHASLGTHMLAAALRLHWLFAYLFLANGLLYAAGLAAGGGWRALLPRGSDAGGAFLMVRHYATVLPAFLLRRRRGPPVFASKYNPLQRLAYFAMPVCGALSVASGWAMHKPVSLPWLERAFGSYDGARQVHFWMMAIFAAFVIPHVVLVLADGWDTLRSMITGWSRRAQEGPDGRS
jgi:thiosulfate reductase cytochrome b subunit